jgi:hypothetical protein
VLMGGSILAVAGLVEEGNLTRTIAVATKDVSAGASARDLDVELFEVPSDTPSLPSLTSEEWESLSDMVANRSLREGDVLSARDFSLPENRDLIGITLDLSIGEPAWLTPGQRVVLWVAPPASENSFSAPFVLSANVLIDSVSRDEGFAADGAFRQVSVLVSAKDVPGVVHALANKYFLYLVPEIR